MRERFSNRQLVAIGLILPAAIYVGVFFYFPLVRLAILSFQNGNGKFSFANYSTFFGTAGYIKSLWVTLYLSFATVVICAIVGYLLAFKISRSGPKVAALLMAIVVLPFWSSVLVRGFAWEELLQPGGLFQKLIADTGLISHNTDIAHSTSGLLIALTQVTLPFMVLPIVASLNSIDPALPRAARSLGAGSWYIFRRVTLPLSKPGLMAGSVLVFLTTVGYYILPAMLGSPGDMFISQVIDVQVNQVLDWGLAAAMSIVLVVVTIAAFGIYGKMFGLDSLGRD